MVIVFPRTTLVCLYVSAAFSVFVFSRLIWTSVAMTSQQWGSSQRGWPQEDWGHNDWTSSSSSGWDRIEHHEPFSSGKKEWHHEPCSSGKDAPTWKPSLDNLRINYEPVVVKPRFLRVVSPPDKAENPAWLEERWAKRVDELNLTEEVCLSGNDAAREFQSEYGKQKKVTKVTLRKPNTPMTYEAGQGSRLYPKDECYLENYEFASWETTFTFNGKEIELPRNNLELEKHACWSEVENLVTARYREASNSRVRSLDEPVPKDEAITVLSSYWHQKEAQYAPGVVPSGNPNRECIMDLDALYDNNPHDGTATPFQSGTKTMCVNGT
jgi:hypothetical protein